MSLSDRKRIEYVLERVFQDVFENPQQKIVSRNKQLFVKHYTKLALTREHETHCLVKVDLDFYRGGSFCTEWLLDNEFYEWLSEKNPTINLGEVNGKHSYVERTFAECESKVVRDYFEVQPYIGGGAPCDLEDLYAQWQQSQGYIVCGDCDKQTSKMQAVTVKSLDNGYENRVCIECARKRYAYANLYTVELLPDDEYVDHGQCADTLGTDEACAACTLVKERKDEQSRIHCDYCGEKTSKMHMVRTKSSEDTFEDVVCVECARKDYMVEDGYEVEPLPNDDEYVDHTKCADTLGTNEACAVCTLVDERRRQCKEAAEPPTKRVRK